MFKPDISLAATVAKAIASDFYNDRLDLSARADAPHGTWSEMPEVKYAEHLRASGESDRSVRLFLTFIAAMDRARDATRLWNNGHDLFQSDRELFEPAKVATMPVLTLRDKLSRAGVSQRHDADSSAWNAIARSLTEDDNPVRRVVDSGQGNAIELLLYLGTEFKKGQPRFPLLKGPKIWPMWMRMLVAPGKAEINDLDIVPVAVDVHVQHVTANLNVLDAEHVSLDQARPAVQHVWRKAVEQTDIDGPSGLPSSCAALDPALWFFGKWGCSHCEKEKKQIRISSACDYCQFHPE